MNCKYLKAQKLRKYGYHNIQNFNYIIRSDSQLKLNTVIHMSRTYKLFLVVTLSLLMSLGTSDSCQPIIQDAINTLNTLNYQVFFQISQIKSQQRVSFAEDQFVVKTKTGTTINYLYAQDVSTVHSNQTVCLQWTTGDLFTICKLTQLFNAKKPSTSQISLYLDSSFEIVLTSSGGTKLTSTVECKNGFIYGWLTESSGVSMFTISLRKVLKQVPR